LLAKGEGWRGGGFGNAAHQADGNLRKALLSLEACKVTQYPFTADQQVQQTDWELYLQEVTGEILAEQSPKCLLGIRTKLYELIINCIPPELILKVCVCERETEWPLAPFACELGTTFQ
jgi:replication factor C subunit 3/5